jgi:hypothetical protein
MQTVSRIYHSREDRVAEFHDKERDRLSTDPHHDSLLADNLASDVWDYMEQLVSRLDNYADTCEGNRNEDDWDSRVEYARREVIERWAAAQSILSKVAFAMRFDGNLAFERLMDTLGTDVPVDMRGL